MNGDRVFVVGAGRVGQGLARAFRIAGVPVVGLHGRRPSDFATSSGKLPREIADANVVLLAVRDEQMDAAAEEVAGGSRPAIAQGAVLLHTSGSTMPASMAAIESSGIATGTFHPLIPFTRPERAPELLKGGWVGIDGSGAAQAAARRLAGRVGARTLDIPSDRASYHAAAVFAANFPVVLAAMAARLMRELGVPSRSAELAVESLMSAAVSNIGGSSPAEALTGPVVRGDVATVKRHLAALRRDDALLSVYRRMSLAAVPMAAERGVPADVISALDRALRGGG